MALVLPSLFLDPSEFFFFWGVCPSTFFPCFRDLPFNLLTDGDPATLTPKTLSTSSSSSNPDDLREDGSWPSVLSFPEGRPFSEDSESEDNDSSDSVVGTWKTK